MSNSMCFSKLPLKFLRARKMINFKYIFVEIIHIQATFFNFQLNGGLPGWKLVSTRR